MIELNTVFVLGAGASAPYGYPTAAELQSYICGSLRSDIVNKLDLGGMDHEDRKELLESLDRLAAKCGRAMNSSIDIWLSRNQEFKEIGKFAIAASIALSENPDSFYHRMKDSEQNWYRFLFQRLTEGIISVDELPRFTNNTIGFITFNYDRSLEYILFETLRNSFSSAPEQQIRLQAEQIPIIHVYGVLDNLPHNGGTKRYGGHYTLKELGKIKDSIIIPSENNGANLEALGLLENARRVFFLGFGYAGENLNVLDLPRALRHDTQVYGTGYKLTEKQIGDIKQRLLKPSQGDTITPIPQIEGLDCRALLQKYL